MCQVFFIRFTLSDKVNIYSNRNKEKNKQIKKEKSMNSVLPNLTKFMSDILTNSADCVIVSSYTKSR